MQEQSKSKRESTLPMTSSRQSKKQKKIYYSEHLVEQLISTEMIGKYLCSCIKSCLFLKCQNGTSYYLLGSGFCEYQTQRLFLFPFQSAYWLSSFDAYLSALDDDLRVIQQTTKCTSWFNEYESRRCKSKAALISNCLLKSNGRHITPKLYVQFHCLCLSHDIKVETLELSWELPAAYYMYIYFLDFSW